jgi:hypothetical protein
MISKYPQVEDTIGGADFHKYFHGRWILDIQMNFIYGCYFNVPCPVLPDGVAQYEGFGQPSWITKYVTLMNKSRVDVARGICHSVSAELVIDSDGLLLDNDRVTLQIVESLLEEEVPLEWMFSMRVWHICRVFLSGANLYDHD